MAKIRKRYKYTTARQVGGDDGYCWCVFVKGEKQPRVTGLTHREVPYYRDRFEKEQEEKHNPRTINPDMRDRARYALARTWDAIGGDALQALAEEGVSSISKDEVIEAVTTCGFIGGYPEMYGNDKEAVQWLEEQPEEVQDLICQEAFPHNRYGM